MSRKVFFSFHFNNDFWRTQQVRNMGSIEGQALYTANAWEEVKRKGDTAIENWIDDNLKGKSCVIVLVGSETATRPWVIEEIVKGWNTGKGVLGIRINELLNQNQKSSTAGANPFDYVTLQGGKTKLSSYAQLKKPAGYDSKSVYSSIKDNIEEWIEEAIKIRNDYKP